MTYRGPMARAVGSALESAKIGNQDSGAAALVRRYAALMDDAQPSARYAEHLAALRSALDTLAATGVVVGVDYEKHYAKITEALAAHSVASDLGPKLLAALTALGLTLAGRGTKGGAAGGPVVTPKSQLDEMRERRKRRTGTDGAQTVDPAAP